MGCFSSSGRHSISKNDANNTPSQIIHTKEDIKIDASMFVGHRNGQVLEHYKIGSKIGSGAFGCVRIGTHIITGQKRAIKTIQKESISADLTEREKFFSEVDILRKTDHPNIVKLYEFYEDEKYFHIVTEFLQGGELFDYIIKNKMLSERAAAVFMKQILSAVAYCHSNNIVHRDLKPENLLLECETPQPNLKVIDFGTSAIFNSSKHMTKKYGTAYYIAPEVLRKDYDEKCDMWSCGVILYILLSGKPPFYGRTDRDILRMVEKGEYSMKGTIWSTISQGAKQLISRMLDYNPKHRISATEALMDDWLAQNTALDSPVQAIPLSSLDNLKSFRAEQNLQRAVLTFIASQLLHNEDSKQLSEAFRNLDKNGDGKISREELLEVYTGIMGLEAASEEVEKIMQQVDVNDSGYIDYTEFIMATAQREKMINQMNLEAAFKVFDSDESGKICAQELKSLLGEGGSGNETMWIDLIREVDMNGDGEIDINEFKAMMMSLVDSHK
ncbi:unnamed protein product [Blepharisma stoltei]|uniref:Calcium-dependent protein kinase 1 n=1 Tax=Blepharisma stoltei TaxID=1481888 RepID=A0AAU9KLU6_9CILI|nr:unnamed protein product [Blepharisma stoltei]